MQSAKTKAELQEHKAKLATSYSALLTEFSSPDLRHVGNYTLGKLIGKGSFGKVYLARHTLTNGSKVVLKATKKDDGNLVREIHHHRQFVHPHIARLYEVVVTESLVWLALEYCPGDELYNYLLRTGPLPAEKAQKIFTQLVGAVAYIHSKSCVHRDLKLENVLLDKHENVKLCDFGFTREYEGKTNYLQTFCGTICYSAPEMLKAEKYAGEKVDVWSLGVILYALLKGELPFDEDDDQATKTKILQDDPTYPDAFPEAAKTLISKMLSKRPLYRPTLADILADPFLAEYAPHQQAVLKLTQPAPFSTPLEKTTLERMKSAGVDIDKVIENVLSQRCDSLAGWWALLIEKEQKKEARRERKRKEKEAEMKLLRRLSAASSRLDKMTSTLEDVPENEQGQLNASTMVGRNRSLSRGRSQRRSTPQILVTDLPKLPEGAAIGTPGNVTPPPPIDKDSVRSRSGSRPPIPSKDRKRRSSTLQMVTTNPDLLGPPNGITKRRSGKKRDNHFFHSLAQLKHWFKDTTKMAKSPKKAHFAEIPPAQPEIRPKITPHQGHIRDVSGTSFATHSSFGMTASPNVSNGPPSIRLDTTRVRPRSSVSPATPHSSYRHHLSGLRGRKSTSSSVSSVRSIQRHSKASSISSNSLDTINSPSRSIGRSPHSSIKVLPITPTLTKFPPNTRFVRDREASGTSTFGQFHDSLPSSARNSVSEDRFDVGSNGNSLNIQAQNSNAASMNSTIPNVGNGMGSTVMFARRRKSPFKGPSMNLMSSYNSHGSLLPSQTSPLPGSGFRQRESSTGHPSFGLRDPAGRRSGSAPGTKNMQDRTGGRKSQIIEEEEEDDHEVNEDAITEVDSAVSTSRTRNSYTQRYRYEDGQIMAEDDDDDVEIEEVDDFEPVSSMVDRRRGESVHSIIIWDDPESPKDKNEDVIPAIPKLSDLVKGIDSDGRALEAS